MTFYLIFTLIVLLSSTIKKNGELILHSLFAILIFIVGFRTIEVGTDTVNYKMYFDVVESGKRLFVEPGWLAINHFVIFFNGSYETLMLLVTLLTLIPVYWACRKYSINPTLSLFFYITLYFYFYSFNISRQLLAISFVLMSFHFLKENRKLSFVFLVLLASTFHTSALIVLPVLFIDKIPDKPILYISAIVVSALVGLFGTESIYDFISLTSYSNYLYKLELGNTVGNAIYLLLLNGFFLFILYFSGKREVYFKLFFLYIVLTNIFVRIPLGSRLIMYFSVIQVLYLPLFIYTNRKENNIFLIAVVIIYAFTIFFKTFGAGDILPYTNRIFN
ncbi:EpsG family protein [Brumimicrobium sp.]|uniref:EpsG family protein n=1 Tax=Brumimicrobium sp. TaxID=2029867 RepID=UPI003A933FE5